MLNLVSDFQQDKPLVLNPKFVDGVKRTLCDSTLDKVRLLLTAMFDCYRSQQALIECSCFAFIRNLLQR